VAALAALAVASPAPAVVCANTPLSQRLDESDAAVVGRVVDTRPAEVEGAAVTLLTVDVDQHVKGDRSSSGHREVRTPTWTSP
jgi:hypothetical protein